ncbi:hypothetical protein Dimus_031182 [Dionaea muscipula]
MDSILSVFALEGLIGFQGNAAPRKVLKDEFDVMIYDGASADETLRMIGAAAATRLYLKYLRNMAEKTDLGRLIGPSLLRLVDEAMSLSGKRPPPSFNGKLSSETWESLENYLERKSSSFAEPDKFGCYVVMDPCSPVSRSAALRYWGCAIQAGAQVSGAFGVTSAGSCGELEAVESSMKTTLSPLPFALITKLSMDSHSPPDWDAIMQNSFGEKARKLLHLPGRGKASTSILPSVKYDLQNKSITLFMPGFNKSEIKLYQYRGGSELLVEAGDQRRVIELPRQVQGKVGGAKFIDRSLKLQLPFDAQVKVELRTACYLKTTCCALNKSMGDGSYKRHNMQAYQRATLHGKAQRASWPSTLHALHICPRPSGQRMLNCAIGSSSGAYNNAQG